MKLDLKIAEMWEACLDELQRLRVDVKDDQDRETIDLIRERLFMVMEDLEDGGVVWG